MEITLGGLAGQAADAGNGAVQTLAVIAVVFLIVTMLLTLASISLYIGTNSDTSSNASAEQAAIRMRRAPSCAVASSSR